MTYKVGIVVIKSMKTRVLEMVTNTRRHPYIYFLIMSDFINGI